MLISLIYSIFVYFIGYNIVELNVLEAATVAITSGILFLYFSKDKYRDEYKVQFNKELSCVRCKHLDKCTFAYKVKEITGMKLEEMSFYCFELKDKAGSNIENLK